MAIEADWWNTEYAENIMQAMRLKEETLPEFVAQSPQLYHRRNLVDWLAVIVDKFNICNTACHLTVYLLDHFMSQHDIPDSTMQLVALGCLSIACKFEERDSKVPRLTELNKLTSNAYSVHELMEMELFVLTFVDWELCIPTAAHFAEYFVQFASAKGDLISNTPVSMLPQVRTSVELYIKYFLDISLQDCAFLKFKPSLVAASCVASTRVCLVLVPTWPVGIQKITKYSFEQLVPCIEVMLRTLEEDQAAAARPSSKRKLEAESEDVPKKQLSPAERGSFGSSGSLLRSDDCSR